MQALYFKQVTCFFQSTMFSFPFPRIPLERFTQNLHSFLGHPRLLYCPNPQGFSFFTCFSFFLLFLFFYFTNSLCTRCLLMSTPSLLISHCSVAREAQGNRMCWILCSGSQNRAWLCPLLSLILCCSDTLVKPVLNRQCH